MLEVVVSGAVTGWAIAIPIGAVGAFIVTLTARSGFRTGAAAGLGVATVDGVYAAVAVVSGAALATFLAPASDALRVVAGVVLLGIAGLTLAHAWTRRAAVDRPERRLGPAAAYALFVGITAVNPATVVYFAAVVLGNQDLVDGPVQGTVFVLAAFVASASWQLSLAGAGALLGRGVTGPRGQLWTGVVSALVIAGLAVHTMLG